MTRGRTISSWMCSWAVGCGAMLLGGACTPSVGAEPHDATSVAPGSAAPDSAAPGSAEPESSAAPLAPSAAAPQATSNEPALTAPAPETMAAEPTPSEPGAKAAGNEPQEGSSGEQMTAFFGIGRGDRIADLAGVSGYSLGPVRRVLGPAGVVYVRRSSPPPSEPAPASGSDDLAKIIWMNTPDEAPLTADATRLNAVTMLFGYHAVIAAGHDRKKLNAAVYRALVPGGLYIIADRAAPPGSGLGAARRLNAIEDDVVRTEVQAAGFQLVEEADFVSNAPGASERSPGSQYVLKFAKPK